MGASAQSCMADLNGDRVVDGTDLAEVLAQWGPCGSRESCSADTNDDGIVNGVDVGTVLAAWGFCPVTVPGWAMLIEAYPDAAVVHDEGLRASIVATGYAWRVRDTSTQIEMVLIPPGTFQMGCSPSNQYGCSSDGRENPVHPVTLTSAFYMGRYEVTQAQWTATMGSNPSYYQSPSDQVPADQVPNRPVERVSWNAIQGFLSATGMRLPSEAEWEYAYRAGTTTAFHSMPGYPSGTNDDNQLGTIAWFSSNSASQTRPVGQKAGNGFGLHDMSGNVWEWVNDRYSSTYYASSPSVNPPGPSSGSNRVLRGGRWGNYSGECRSSWRSYFAPSGVSVTYGFRVARAP
jgi:formylglycine-generating enzyme required for sulfatase activity